MLAKTAKTLSMCQSFQLKSTTPEETVTAFPPILELSNTLKLEWWVTHSERANLIINKTMHKMSRNIDVHYSSTKQKNTILKFCFPN